MTEFQIKLCQNIPAEYADTMKPILVRLVHIRSDLIGLTPDKLLSSYPLINREAFRWFSAFHSGFVLGINSMNFI